MRKARATRILSLLTVLLLLGLALIPGGVAHGFSVESTDIPEQVEATGNAQSPPAVEPNTPSGEAAPTDLPSSGVPAAGDPSSPAATTPEFTPATPAATASPEATAQASGSNWPAIILGAVVFVGVVMVALFLLQKRQE
ncbi:MAG: hypothetical protein FJX76_27125 [Armatimonadetes bacterium]|nr:hypothetical protein [Armatimonadota bacterium]